MRKQELVQGVDGWIAELVDGSVIKQADDIKWGDIKDKVTKLSMSFRGVEFSLPSMMPKYTQKQSGSCEIDGSKLKVISRSIGFVGYDGREVSVIFWESGKITMETR